jgi:CRISPR-associated protein Cmr2
MTAAYTAISFAPVQDFIEKSRKLRDLYGSSFILSYLSEQICKAAQDYLHDKEAIVSPALINVTQGTPNQITVRGQFPTTAAKQAFDVAWSKLLDACRTWIEEHCRTWIDAEYQTWVDRQEWQAKASRTLPWERDWRLWHNHTWEFFCEHGPTIPHAWETLTAVKRSRNWIGVNWMGESSTLSGADAVAWPGLDRNVRAKQRRISDEDQAIASFYQHFSQKLGEAVLTEDLRKSRNQKLRLAELAKRYGITVDDRADPDHPDHAAFIQELTKKSEHTAFKQLLAQKMGEAIVSPREQLSIPELTKRLITLEEIAKPLGIEYPSSFQDINLWRDDSDYWFGWFCGDGDRAGNYIQKVTKQANGADELYRFSTLMRNWGQTLQQKFEPDKDRNNDNREGFGRIIYAGGDDFLGVFYPAKTASHCIDWFRTFKSDIWDMDQGKPQPKPITPSVGFVWASPNVPQRDVLQHCREAEKSAKNGGRDRLALRVLFNGGNYLEWVCPWWFLGSIIDGYRDRNGGKNWTHFYNDVAILESRHAFMGNHAVALGLFNIYFGDRTPQNSFLPEAEQLFAEDSPLWSQRTPDPPSRDKKAGILNDDLANQPLHKQQAAFNTWVINLAKVGFHLLGDRPSTLIQPQPVVAA